jgi:putative transcription factor
MLCEVCGAEVARTKAISVEGTVLNACPNCAKFGRDADPPRARGPTAPPVVAQRLEARRRRMTEKDLYAQAGEEELVVDYDDRIRRAREARGWKQTDLGAKINERATIIAKLESATMVPNDALIRRLERALGIKLKDKVPPPAVKKASAAQNGITLGDLFDLDGEG